MPPPTPPGWSSPPARSAIIVPLCVNSEAVATQYPMKTLEELGLLKMDFLGLRNLTVIADAEKLIRRREPGFAVEGLPLDDQGGLRHALRRQQRRRVSDGILRPQAGTHAA